MNEGKIITDKEVTKEKCSRDDSRRDKADAFVQTVIKRCREDKGYAARLRRADNPATEYQSWEILASFGIDLERPNERLPYSVVGAGIAKAKLEENGRYPLGAALASCYQQGRESPPAAARMRRLLACQDTVELCRVIRPVLSLIANRGTLHMDYAELLRDLIYFNWRKKDIKAKWAMKFYSYTPGVGGQNGQ